MDRPGPGWIVTGPDAFSRLHASVAAALVAAGGLVCQVGCVSEVRQSPPKISRPKVSRPAKPAGVRPEQMMLSAGVATDADGNTFPDTIPVVIYLFGDTSRYALPLHADGEFEFEVVGTQEGRIGRWIFPAEEVVRAAGDSAAGVCYRFGLRLGSGRDVIEGQTAGIRAVFTDSETGRRIESLGAVTIRLGSGE